MAWLLDTCVVLWAAREPDRLPLSVRNTLQNPDEDIFLSVATAWEISVKQERLGIKNAPKWFQQAVQKLQASVLPIRLDHIERLNTLPRLHKDPFDRILIAQAVAGKYQLITSDENVRRYPAVRCCWD